MNHHYVFVGTDNDFFRTLYKGFEEKSDCTLQLIAPTTMKRPFIDKVLTSKKIPLYNFRLAIRENINFRSLMKSQNDNQLGNYKSNIVIIYSRVYERFGTAVLKYYRKRYSNCKLVCYYGDLIECHCCDIQDIKKHFDLVASFDKEQAAKYDIAYIHEPYSYTPKENKVAPIYDIFFVGAAKGERRLNMIHKIYNRLSSLNFKCLFYIVGVDEKNQINRQIIYNQPIPYHDVIEKIQKSRFILEVMQDDAVSPSSRFSESVIFNKGLITDCRVFTDDFLPPNVIRFNKIEDIDTEKIEKLSFSKNDLEKYRYPLSIDNMITNIYLLLGLR